MHRRFELPGCVTSYSTISEASGCGGVGTLLPTFLREGDHGRTGDGQAVHNVTIDDVRLNDFDVCAGGAHESTCPSSYAGFWSAMTPDHTAHTNLTLTHVVALRTGRDGINVHGNVRAFAAEDVHFENAGDDTFAVWGAYEPGGNVSFRRASAYRSPGNSTRWPWQWLSGKGWQWGDCVALYGAGSVAFDGVKCCTSNEAWHFPLFGGLYAIHLRGYLFKGDWANLDLRVTNLKWYRSHESPLHPDEPLCGKRRSVGMDWPAPAGFDPARVNLSASGCVQQ